MYGCNNFCTYCIVPYVRGRERSRNSNEVIEECRELVASGIKEITLLGQNVNSYKSDMTFPELLDKIAKIDGDFIIRFMTSHPKDTSPALVEVMAKHNPKIAPFFHLPLQSGSDKVLKSMNRTYTKEKYLSIATMLKEEIPDIALSTDVIVGFPGETEEDFLDTLDVIEKVRFDNVYAFIYSEREGTRAATMENKVDKAIRHSRLDRLLEVQDKIAIERNLPYEKKIIRVLVDSSDFRQGKIIYNGRSLTGKLVHFTSERECIGELVNVKINKANAFDLIGEITE
jgi:tRNA-2-methylthio-N6-dimethylallyladenosine synthase